MARRGQGDPNQWYSGMRWNAWSPQYPKPRNNRAKNVEKEKKEEVPGAYDAMPSGSSLSSSSPPSTDNQARAFMDAFMKFTKEQDQEVPPSAQRVPQTRCERRLEGQTEKIEPAQSHSSEDRGQEEGDQKRRRAMAMLDSGDKGAHQEAEATPRGAGCEVAGRVGDPLEKGRGVESWKNGGRRAAYQRGRRRGRHRNSAWQRCRGTSNFAYGSEGDDGEWFQQAAARYEGADGRRVSYEIRSCVCICKPLHAATVPTLLANDADADGPKHGESDGIAPSECAWFGCSIAGRTAGKGCALYQEIQSPGSRRRTFPVWKAAGDYATEIGEITWYTGREWLAPPDPSRGRIGMRIVPASKDRWGDHRKFQEKFTTFALLIAGDIVIFIATFAFLNWFDKPRSTRLVIIAHARTKRPAKRKRSRRTFRILLLWYLYWHGTHPELCQLGLRAVSAASVPNAGWSDNGFQDGNFDDAFSLMSIPGGGSSEDSNLFAPMPNSVFDNPEVAVQEDDQGFDDQDEDLEEASESGSCGDSSDGRSGEGGDGGDLSENGHEERDQDMGDEQACNMRHHDPGDDQGGEVRGVDSHDWNNVFQFRRHYSMRQCFIRWTSYRNIVSGVAHTWDVNMDDVYAVHDMAVHPPGIVPTSQPVIVQLWGDDLPHEVGMAVLVDLEIYLPASYIESHIRDRHVLKFPQFVTRVQILHLSKASGLCESRQQRCLVSHNKISVPLQASTSYEVRNGDYFLVQVPPLEDCVPQEPPHGMNLVQKYVRTFRGLTTPRWAPGNAEEATRDPSHVVGPLCLSFIFPYHVCHRHLCKSELSSTGPGVFAAFSTPWLREVDVEDVMIAVNTTYRDPMEGLPDPGNPRG